MFVTWLSTLVIALATNSAAKEQPWTVEESKSRLDDSAQVVISRPATEGVGTLVLQCRENQLIVAVLADSVVHIDSRRPLPVTLRVGTETAKRENWITSANNKGAGLWNTKASLATFRKIEKASSVFARLHGYRSDVDLFFPLEGLSEHLPKLKAACKISD